MAEEEEVYIPSVIELLKNIFLFVPLRLRNFVAYHLVGTGMDTFIGRRGQTSITGK